MRMEKVNKRLADWGEFMVSPAECTVALSRGTEDCGTAVEEAPSIWVRPHNQSTATDIQKNQIEGSQIRSKYQGTLVHLNYLEGPFTILYAR